MTSRDIAQLIALKNTIWKPDDQDPHRFTPQRHKASLSPSQQLLFVAGHP
jgi:hypothetical protein